jgi:uncharacterized protein YukE
MSDQIYYNYGANYGHLDDINASINAASQVRENVHGAFNALTAVYEGNAAHGLQQAHQQCSQKMDGVCSDLQTTHNQAVERQALTAQQDQQLSGNF